MDKYKKKVGYLLEKLNKFLEGKPVAMDDPIDMFQLLCLSFIGAYDEANKWVIDSLENPNADFILIKDLKGINLVTVRDDILTLISNVPDAAKNYLIGLLDGINFMMEMVIICDMYSDNEEKRIKITSLIKKYTDLKSKIGEAFIFLEETREVLDNMQELNKVDCTLKQ